MVDAKRMLDDLKKLRRKLDADLREQHKESPQRDAAETEWREALEARRTADTFETFWTAALDQAAVHWILGVIFLRFLEDNRLLDRPFLSGPGERLELSAERQRAGVVQNRPFLGDKRARGSSRLCGPDLDRRSCVVRWRRSTSPVQARWV